MNELAHVAGYSAVKHRLLNFLQSLNEVESLNVLYDELKLLIRKGNRINASAIKDLHHE